MPSFPLEKGYIVLPAAYQTVTSLAWGSRLLSRERQVSLIGFCQLKQLLIQLQVARPHSFRERVRTQAPTPPPVTEPENTLRLFYARPEPHGWRGSAIWSLERHAFPRPILGVIYKRVRCYTCIRFPADLRDLEIYPW